MTEQHSTATLGFTGSLSADDRQVLRARISDVSDIDPRSQQRLQASFHYALEVARGVSNGTVDPLSA